MDYVVRLNSTSKGVLHKGITQDGKLYFKTGFCDEYGDFENHSVKSECIAYEIGKALGLDVLKQELSYSGDVLTCKSENFLKPGESLVTLAKPGDKYKDYHIRFLWDESNSAKPDLSGA